MWLNIKNISQAYKCFRLFDPFLFILGNERRKFRGAFLLEILHKNHT